jgi:hypothetical protein
MPHNVNYLRSKLLAVPIDGGDTRKGDVYLHIDPPTHNLITIETEHHEIHTGGHFFVQGYIDVPALNDVLDFTWLMPDSSKWIHWTWEIDTEKEVLWQVYEGAVVVNPLGDTITPLNSDRNSPNLSATIMKYELQADLAAANVDTVVSAATLLGQGISGAGQKAGRAERHHELIMGQNTLYCLRATAGAAGYINFDMHWYEHTNRD